MRILLSVLSILISMSLFAQPSDIPLTNWTVPPYASAESGGITTMTDVTSPRLFIGVQPCRIVDTRGGGVFIGAYGPPIMAAGATRTFDLNNAPHCPGIPAQVDAYSVNFTITQTAGAPGDIRVWPTGAPPVQLTSVLNWTVPNATLANAAIVPAGPGGSIDVQVAGSNTHLLVDINGYFSGTLGNPANAFQLRNNSNSATAELYNASTACGGTCGLYVEAASGDGILGTAQEASADVNFGVRGRVLSTGNGSAGVSGIAVGNSGIVAGILGVTNSGADGAAGVQGIAAGGAPAGQENLATGGVRGLSNGGFGVFGISATGGSGAGVRGVLLSGGSAQLANGYLGYAAGADPPGAPPWAVFGSGDIGATGTKHFLDPHPTDPSLVISYVSLEGPEAGTYFRGRAKFQNGIARILVPEHFRLVTDPDGLTVQVTPIGGMASVGVVRVDLNEIVVQSSRNLEFSYLVQGIRKTFRNVVPIRPGSEFMPESARATMPESLSAEQRRLLIQNGTYREDGTVNIETARQLGWEKAWSERSRATPAPTPE